MAPPAAAGRHRSEGREVLDARTQIRNIDTDQALLETDRGREALANREIEGTMARQQEQIVETATEARQAEPGPSVLALLTISTGLAVLILGVVWFVFFRT